MRSALLTALLFLAACGGQGTLFTSTLKPLPIVSTSSALVHVVPQTNRAVVIRPGTTKPTALRLSAGARLARRIPQANALLVLSGTPRAPTLDVVDLDADDVQTLALPGFFDLVTFNPAGSFGVLTYDAGSSTGPLVARNLNELALFETATRTLSRVQLDTESLAPRGVLFGPAEPNRQLVAVTLERGVAIFDARHPDVAPRRITIRPPGSTSEQSVSEAVFSLDAKWLFLRVSTLDDVIAIELGDEVGQPLSASINFVSGGQGLTDLEVAPQGFPDSVLAVYATSRELWLLDAHGIQDRARKLVSPEAINAVTSLGGTKVLAWAGGGSKGVVAWDLADGRSGTSVLDGAANAPTLVPTIGKALFFHSATTQGGPSLSTVTLADETNRIRLRLQSIQLAHAEQAATVDDASQRLFFSVSGSTSVVTLELSTLQLQEMSLDTAPASLVHLAEQDWLAAFTNAPDRLGDVTLWPAGEVDRTKAIRFTDYLLTGDLDRAEAP